MKMKKIVTLGLASCILLGGVTASHAMYDPNVNYSKIDSTQPRIMLMEGESIAVPISAQTFKVDVKEIKTESEYLIVNARIPQLKGLKDEAYQLSLNENIMKEAMAYINEAEKESKEFAEDCKKNGWEVRPNTVTVQFELKDNSGIDNSIVSLEVIKAFNNGGTGNPEIDFYNISNKDKAEELTLKDLLGEKYKEIADDQIKKQIEQDKDMYFNGIEGFKGISGNQKFYYENGNVVIVFDKYEIAPGATGIPEFKIEIPQDSIGGFHFVLVINNEGIKTNVYQKEDGTIMVPLRLVSEKLGYEVKWIEENRSIEIKKGAQYTSVKPGEDKYFFAKMAPISLGAAPEIKDSTTYVPFKFVSDILKVDASMDETGVITINNK
ncbi:stalk domain-containing protein [Tepidibacter hydrothermalis]|uniref:Stalk domain-containing protein n=1 Tax=Tepidibacter hydrothermalis TaxID=3036126 RepID=A0ABY8E9Y4_9FIRM|nr:stalk domain-containing protein [Tepidibacter hydrothermalis]WFD09716.1 stalk domain-containing protein [Tepidibacter hydrothermalis]